MSTPSRGCASTIGTCFSAAAWNTNSGRASAKAAASRVAVAHVGDDGAARQARKALADLEIDRVERELAVVEQRQLGRREGRHLAHQLAADRAAGAGDEDALAAHQPRHRVAVEHRLRPAEQVLERDRAQLDLVGDPVAQLLDLRHPGDAEAELVGGVDEAADARRRRTRG